MLISAANYSDLKDIVNALPFKTIAVFTNGQASPPNDFQIMVVSHEFKIAVTSNGQSNPSPPPSFIQPSTFTTDFPGAVSLAAIPILTF